MLAVPNPARTSSRTRTRAGASCASIRRRITALWGSAGIARASRHSITVLVVTHLLRQIKDPGS